MRKHFQGDFSLTEGNRRRAQQIITTLQGVLIPGDPVTAQQERLALIGQMLLTYPTGDNSQASAMARASTYLQTLADIPPWAINDSIERWNRGEAGEYNYSFAPAPAILRKLALAHTAAPERIIEHMKELLEATSYDAALCDERPASSDTTVVTSPRLKGMT